MGFKAARALGGKFPDPIAGEFEAGVAVRTQITPRLSLEALVTVAFDASCPFDVMTLPAHPP